MSREALHESLSAVMDNEADELELRRVLAASDDQEVRATWSRYQIARAVMHKELIEPRLDISAAVSAAIADEAVPSVPARAGAAWRNLGRLAVAASVTVAVLAGVRLYNQNDVAAPQLAQETLRQLSPCRRPLRGRLYWQVIVRGRRRCRRSLRPKLHRLIAGTKSVCRPMCVSMPSKRHLEVARTVRCRMLAQPAWKNAN